MRGPPPPYWRGWWADRAPACRAASSGWKRQGVILGYGVRLAPEHGLGAVRAHVMIKVGPKEARAVTAALRAIEHVRVLHSVSGEVDLIAVAYRIVAEMDRSSIASARSMAWSARPHRSSFRRNSSVSRLSGLPDLLVRQAGEIKNGAGF